MRSVQNVPCLPVMPWHQHACRCRAAIIGAASTAAFTASSIRSNGSMPSRSLTMRDRLVLAGAVDGEEDRDASASASFQALITPSAITSVRAKAPQKLTTRLFTRGLDSTSSSAGLALV